MKKRLDCVLVERAYATGREPAKDLIRKGQVYINGVKVVKPSTEIGEEDLVEIVGETLKYVSRGGLKLEKALQVFKLSLNHCHCCDFGASTGGFTDCMLQNGATKVYAVDVGTAQLAEKLLKDPRVVNMEKTNIRNITTQQISEEIHFISIDVSFISLKLILPVAFSLLTQNGICVCLIKPQFEAGREKVGKKGVVKEPNVHVQVIQTIWRCAEELGFGVKGLSSSPIKGPEGNIEYLMCLCKEGISEIDFSIIQQLVKDTHCELHS